MQHFEYMIQYIFCLNFQHSSDTCCLPLNSLSVLVIRRESIIQRVQEVSCIVQ